ASAREFLQEVDRIQTRLSRAEKTTVMPPRPSPPEPKPPATPPAAPPSPLVAAPAEAPPEKRSGGPGYLFGAAAVILAAAALIWIWKTTSPQPERVAQVASPPTAASAEPTPAATTPAPTVPTLPTA